MEGRRHYVVFLLGRRSRMEVTVTEAAIALRGERPAVAQAAWFKLLGKGELGEDLDKNLETRHFIMTEIRSRPEHEREDVFLLFQTKISFTWVKNI